MLSVSHLLKLCFLFVGLILIILCFSFCSQVQENIFVEFNHQQLLEFYDKVCLFCLEYESVWYQCSCWISSWLIRRLAWQHLSTPCLLLTFLYFCFSLFLLVNFSSIFLWKFTSFFFSWKLKIFLCFLSAWNRPRTVGFPDLMPSAQPRPHKQHVVSVDVDSWASCQRPRNSSSALTY